MRLLTDYVIKRLIVFGSLTLDTTPWLLQLHWWRYRFMNLFSNSSSMTFIMLIFFYIGLCHYFLRLWSLILSLPRCPAPVFGTNPKSYNQSIRTQPVLSLMELLPLAEHGGWRQPHGCLGELQLPTTSSTCWSSDSRRIPDPSKLSTASATPSKKRKAKATPKAPAKRRRNSTRSPSCSPSPLPTWTNDEKQKLRTLKSDEKSWFSWRVISNKMGKSEHDVRSMWNQIKDKLGWLGCTGPILPHRYLQLKKQRCRAVLMHCDFSIQVPSNIVILILAMFIQLLYMIPYFQLRSNQYVTLLSFGPLLYATRHGPRPDLLAHTIQITNKGTLLLNGYITISSATELDPSGTYTSSPCDIESWFEAYMQQLADRNPYILTSWHHRLPATCLLMNMTVFFRPSRWSTPIMQTDISWRTSRPWSLTLWHNDGRSTYSRPIFTSCWTPTKALKSWTIYHIQFSTFSIGIIRLGRSTNTWTPLLRALPLLFRWSLIPTSRTLACSCASKVSPVGIHSSHRRGLLHLEIWITYPICRDGKWFLAHTPICSLTFTDRMTFFTCDFRL